MRDAHPDRLISLLQLRALDELIANEARPMGGLRRPDEAMAEAAGFETLEQRLEHLALEYHRAIDGEYGCPGPGCSDVVQLAARLRAAARWACSTR